LGFKRDKGAAGKGGRVSEKKKKVIYSSAGNKSLKRKKGETSQSKDRRKKADRPSFNASPGGRERIEPYELEKGPNRKQKKRFDHADQDLTVEKTQHIHNKRHYGKKKPGKKSSS